MELLARELKNSLYFKKWNFLALILRNLYFLKRKLFYISGNETFLYFRKRKPRKNSLYLRKQNFYISENGNPGKISVLGKGNRKP